MSIQTGLKVWSDEDREQRTTGIDISNMAHAALEDKAPIFAESFEDVIRVRVFQTTEIAIRRTAPNTPDRPDDPTAYTPNLDNRSDGLEDSGMIQTNLAVATDGGTAKGDK